MQCAAKGSNPPSLSGTQGFAARSRRSVRFYDLAELGSHAQRRSGNRPSCRSNGLRRWSSPECPLPQCGRGALATAANVGSPPEEGKERASRDLYDYVDSQLIGDASRPKMFCPTDGPQIAIRAKERSFDSLLRVSSRPRSAFRSGSNLALRQA